MLKGNEGFTLIEVIASLVVVAILAAVAGLGIVQVTQGLLYTRDSSSNALEAQIAVMRIEKELHIVTSVSSSSGANTLIYTNNKNNTSATFTICKNGSYIDICSGSNCSGGNHLIDKVSSLTFTYLASDGSTAVAPAVAKIINVSFSISGIDGTTSTFAASVAPSML